MKGVYLKLGARIFFYSICLTFRDHRRQIGKKHVNVKEKEMPPPTGYCAYGPVVIRRTVATPSTVREYACPSVHAVDVHKRISRVQAAIYRNDEDEQSRSQGRWKAKKKARCDPNSIATSIDLFFYFTF